MCQYPAIRRVQQLGESNGGISDRCRLGCANPYAVRSGYGCSLGAGGANGYDRIVTGPRFHVKTYVYVGRDYSDCFAGAGDGTDSLMGFAAPSPGAITAIGLGLIERMVGMVKNLIEAIVLL